MSAPVHHDGESVEALARRLVELLREEGFGPVLVGPAELARRLGVSEDYVYRHAEELGVIRLGLGPKSPLRFDPVAVIARLRARAGEEPLTPQRRKAGAVRRVRDTDLLPIKGKSL